MSGRGEPGFRPDSKVMGELERAFGDLVNAVVDYRKVNGRQGIAGVSAARQRLEKLVDEYAHEGRIAFTAGQSDEAGQARGVELGGRS